VPAEAAPVWQLDATGQAEAIRRGETTPAALLEVALARAGRLNPHLNAVIATFEDVARQQLAQLDPSTPFAGVPLLLKDAVQELAGTPYAIGTRALKESGYLSTQTTEYTRRLLRAGFIIFGKTNVPELSSGFTTEPEAFGPTLNPWDLQRIVGGSSGGAAAAVAAGIVPIAHGCDATGSLRVPASACGLVTLRPSKGVVPPLAPADQGSDVWTDFVLTRSVRDLVGVLDATGDTGALAEAETRPLRIGILRRDLFTPLPLDEACIAAVDTTANTLRALGYTVEESHPASYEDVFNRVGRDIGVMVACSRVPQVRWIEQRIGRPLREGDLSAEVLRTAAIGEAISDAEAHVAEVRVTAAMRESLEWWTQFDILVTPVLRQRPWLIGTADGPAAGSLFVTPSSFTGQPSMSLPLHWTEDGLPVGVQFIGAPDADRTVLALAAELERHMPWGHRWPRLALDEVR